MATLSVTDSAWATLTPTNDISAKLGNEGTPWYWGSKSEPSGYGDAVKVDPGGERIFSGGLTYYFRLREGGGTQSLIYQDVA